MNSRKVLLYLKLILILVISIKLTGCSEEQPVNPDGNVKVKLSVVWDSLGNGSGKMKIKNAKVILMSEYGSTVKYTNNEGDLVVENLPSGTYSISAFSPLPDDNNILLSGSLENLNYNSSKEYVDTIYVSAHSSNGIVINEIYTAGSINSIHYVWDQYIELYNSSDSVLYLDGCQIARLTATTDGPISDAGSDLDNDGDIEKVLNLSKFPGKPGEKNFAFPPRTFLVLAVDAIDHSQFAQNSLNLTNADWEFYNQYSSDDINNPNVKDLTNMIPEKTTDFSMSTTVGILIITNGKDEIWQDGLDISTILDGIEYENQPNGRKTLDSRIDRGHVFSPPIYSGKSLQRNRPGLDSNNGLIDWGIIEHSTPGYQ